jgi:hypothetical protein
MTLQFADSRKLSRPSPPFPERTLTTAWAVELRSPEKSFAKIDGRYG